MSVTIKRIKTTAAVSVLTGDDHYMIVTHASLGVEVAQYRITL